jgi:hypothetical protein
MSKPTKSAAAVVAKMLKNRKPVKVSRKPSTKGKPVAVKRASTLPPPPAKARKAAKQLEHQIEEAAARGDRKLVEKLTVVKAPAKAAKLTLVAAPKAPAAKPVKASKPAVKGALAERIESYILAVAKEYTETYANSLRSPLNAFAVWCASKSITEVKHLNTHALERFVKHTVAQGKALSTTRMGLARVQTFCRVSEVDADLSVLRIQHTVEEKEARAEAAQMASEE